MWESLQWKCGVRGCAVTGVAVGTLQPGLSPTTVPSRVDECAIHAQGGMVCECWRCDECCCEIVEGDGTVSVGECVFLITVYVLLFSYV